MKYLGRLALLFLLAVKAYATVTVTIDVSSITGGNLPGSSIVISLQHCATARVVGTGQMVPQTQTVFPHFGASTITLFDNSQINCSGQIVSYYSFAFIYQGVTTTIGSYNLPPGVYQLANLTPCTGTACYGPVPSTAVNSITKSTPAIGALTFTGPGVSQSGNTFTFSGGSVGSVSSVFSRTGDIVAQTGDYTVSQITGAAPLASPTLTGTVTIPGAVANGSTLSLTNPTTITNAANAIFTLTSSNTANTASFLNNTSTGSHSWADLVQGSAGANVGERCWLDLTAGIVPFCTSSTLFHFINTAVIGWSVGVATGGSGADTGFSRDSAGVVDLGNGSQGNKSGTLNLANLNVTGTCTGCGGGGSISGQTAGYAIEAATVTTATTRFPLDDGVTLANYITASKKFQVVSGGSDPSEFSLVQNGNAPTVVANAFSLAAPATVTTANTVVGFTAPCSGVWTLTNTAGVMASTCTSPTTTIASGTAALGTSAIASGACATVVTATATGTATTDVVGWSFNGDVTAVTGYAPVTTGGVSLYVYPTANTFNVKVCNPTSSSITPGAVTLNWHVTR